MQDHPEHETPHSPTVAQAERPRARGRGCLLILLGLLTLFLALLGGLKLYRQQYRLTAEKLDAARARWQAAGVRSYDLEVTVSGTTSGHYQLKVRDHRIVAGTLNGQPFENLEQARPWTIPNLFDILEQDLANDARPESRRAATQVEFDDADGHVVRYVRQQLGGGGQKIDLTTKLLPVPDDRSSARD